MTLFWICLAWMAGIALAPHVGFPQEALLPPGILLILLAVCVPRRFRMAFCLLAFGFLGGARWLVAQPVPGESFLGTHWYRPAELELILEEDAQASGNGIRFRARAELLRDPGHAEWIDLDGGVLVNFRERPSVWEPHYGDRIRVRGVLQPPPETEGFDYAAYLAHQGVFAVLSDPEVESVLPDQGNAVLQALAEFRRRARATVRALYAEPEGSLLAGILLGDESGISAEIQEAFSRTGTSHIVAISGFNISIVAAIFLSLTKQFPRRWNAWVLAAIGIFTYTLLVGASASVVRAAVMGFLSLLARQIGRQSHGLTSLAFSGAVMTAVNPDTVWDIGFQLSFAATLGLILFADPMQQAVQRLLQMRLSAKRAASLAGMAGEIFLMTFAAQITTLPLMLFYFHSVSLGALLVNPLILSVQPLIMIAGGLSVLAGMVWLPAGQSISWAAWGPTAYTIRIVQFGSSFPAGWWPLGETPAGWIVLFYIVLFGSVGLARTDRLPAVSWGRTTASRAAGAAVPVLTVAVYLAWNTYFQQPDGRVHLTAISSDRGDLVLVRSPSGGTVLVHAGGDANTVLAALGAELGPAGRRLDWVILVPPSNKEGALWEELAVRYDFGGVAYPAGTEREDGVVGEILARCRAEGETVVSIRSGDRFDLGNGAGIVFLAGEDGQFLLAVESGDSRWLLPLAMRGELADALIAAGRVPGAQILFPVAVGSDWYAPLWLDRARPITAVSLAGEESGWPADQAPTHVNTFGRIDFATDGNQLWTRVR